MENNEQFKKDLLNVCGNFAKTSLDCIEKQNTELEQLQNEKQQLITWLKNKIKENNKKKRIWKSFAFGKYVAYQEVLDFIEKGGKE